MSSGLKRGDKEETRGNAVCCSLISVCRDNDTHHKWNVTYGKRLDELYVPILQPLRHFKRLIPIARPLGIIIFTPPIIHDSVLGFFIHFPSVQ